MHRQLVVVIGLIEREDKFLLTRRNDPKHANWHHRWNFPGGKVNQGETPLDAIHREIYEETQLNIHSPHFLGVHTHHWDTSTGTQQTFLLVYHCQVHPGEIILSLEENDAFLWVELEKIPLVPHLLDSMIPLLESLCFDKLKNRETVNAAHNFPMSR